MLDCTVILHYSLLKRIVIDMTYILFQCWLMLNVQMQLCSPQLSHAIELIKRFLGVIDLHQLMVQRTRSVCRPFTKRPALASLEINLAMLACTSFERDL